MNICVISNSHAASLKNGWETIGERFPNIDITFFAAPNEGIQDQKSFSEKGFGDDIGWLWSNRY